jgi:glycosyltransferase involved in cell wall biosynthesis
MTGVAFRPCAVVPVYNHGATAGRVTAALRAHGLYVILVDDASDADTKRLLQDIVDKTEGCRLVTLPENLGKGGAVMRGLEEAWATGFTHALQADADGQHDLARVPEFLARGGRQPVALIAGCPVFDASVPVARLAGRAITNFWVRLETLSPDIVDAMCGFRLYPLAACHRLFATCRLRRRMEFDIEVFVRLHWRGVPFVFLPLAVTYPPGGVSHFRMFKDNLAIALMHTCLFLEMLARAPEIILRKIRRRAAGENADGALV